MMYTEAYQFITSLNNVARKEYLKTAKDCQIYLDRLQLLLDLLGNPEKKIPHYIHVTGTSGKGSVCLMLGNILRASGKRTGILTSPSPDGLVGRTEINGVPMSKPDFARVVSTIKLALERYVAIGTFDIPSPFEILTALSLLYFAERSVSWAVVEVGLGGRYDSTNVIPYKDVAVITNIGLDHAELIGPTKQDIAYEKAGIIKPGCTVFTGEKNAAILNIIKQECRASGSPLILANTFFETTTPKKPFTVTFTFDGTEYTLPTLGNHQIGNAALCIEIARSLGIADAAIHKGLATVTLPIRMEVVSKKPLIILDGAHNPEKMKTTVETIHQLQAASHNKLPAIHLIVGFSADKNITTMIKQLASLRPTSVACTRFTQNIFRKTMNPIELAKLFKRAVPLSTVQAFLDPREALAWSKQRQKAGDGLLVTGSMYLSGELRSTFKIRP